MKKKENTEDKILEAAQKVFVRKGKDGTRMQEIADEAKINKSLLHYYYRSKEKLFGSVFKFAFSKFAPDLANVFNSDDSFLRKISFFIDKYIDTINKNPFIPMFILNEVNKKDASFVINVIKNSGINVDFIKEQIDEAVINGEIKETNAKALIINVIALCAFPFIGKPLLKVIIFDDDDNAYDDFLKQRKKEVTKLIIDSIKK